MSARWGTVARCTLGFAALGAGFVHLALAIDAPTGVAVAFVGVGALEFVWGVLALGFGRVPVPRVALVGSLVLLGVGVVVLLVVGASRIEPLTGSLRPLPVIAATLLDLTVAAVLATGLRRGMPDPATRARRAAGVVVAAILVAAIALPALGAAGVSAVADPPVEHPDPHR
jgi:hypothetical protein